jgi:hypothetical protein
VKKHTETVTNDKPSGGTYSGKQFFMKMNIVKHNIKIDLTIKY